MNSKYCPVCKTFTDHTELDHAAARGERYINRVNKHIYGIVDGCQTQDDWIELAIAAIDQAGFSVEEQAAIRKLLTDVKGGKL